MLSKFSAGLVLCAAFAAGQTSFSISGLNPTGAPVGSPATPLTITGQNFAAGSTVSWTAPNGQIVTLTPGLVQAAQIAASIPAVLLTTAGTAQVAVSNAAGVLSNQLPFNIALSASSLAISGLSPVSAPFGSPATPLTITGQNFAPGSTVSWTSPGGQTIPLTPGLIQAAQIAATIPAALLTSAGTAEVAVANPAGVLSNQLPFNISLASLAVTAMSLPDGRLGSAYGPATLAATGGTPPYKWSYPGGRLPPGLGLDKAGVLSGTPAAAGTFPFGVWVTDSTGAFAPGSFSVKVFPLPLTITTPATLPSGVALSQYPSQILSAAGGIPPYSFNITGSLPGGLIFSNGEISGTPAGAGSSGFTLTVTDSSIPQLLASSPEQIKILPSTPANLLIGESGAAFALTTSSNGLPPPVVIPVSSSSASQQIDYSTMVMPAASWLTVTSGSTTPGGVTVALSAQALSLAASDTPYETSVVLTCTAPSACAGSTQTIKVSATVTTSAPQLGFGPALLTFTGSSANPPAPQNLSIQNTGGGSLQIVSISAADPWVTVSAFPASLAGGPATPVSITAVPTGLDAGFYQSAVNILTSSGSATVPVTLLVTNNPSMTLTPGGTQFSMPAGGSLGNPTDSFAVTFTGGAAGFTASVLPGAAWLSIKTQSAGAVTFSIDPVVSAGLAPGTYYGTIRTTAMGVVNTPQDFQVILTIAPATSPTVPDPIPSGLAFVAGGATIPSQTVQLFASSTTALPYQASATTSDGQAWLTVTPSSGTTSSGAPASSTVTVSTAGLAAGVYRGFVTYQYGGSTVGVVNVTFIVPSGASSGAPNSISAAARSPKPAAAQNCTATQLVPAPTSPFSSFAAAISWPTPIAVNLLDNCGAAVTNGLVTTTFSNGDPPLALSLTNSSTGLYSGTWTPGGSSSQVTITATATAIGFPAATALISGQAKPNAAPAISPNAFLPIFNPYAIGPSFAPGDVVQIYGTNFSVQTGQPSIPLPPTVVGTSVLIGGILSPLFYVGPTQIDAQIPFELTAGNQYQVIVSANGAVSTPVSIQMNWVSPSILPYPESTEQLVAQRLDGSLVSDAAPAKPGELLVLYVAGMGLTDSSAVTDGAASPGSPLANALVQPALTMDGEPVHILFAGLTPTLVGLYQVDFEVPQDAQNGYHAFVLTQSGTAANQTLLAVHQ